MVLKLSLPKDKYIWALSNPVSNEYIQDNDGIGFQKCNLIIAAADKQPVEINIEDYPRWAQSMIKRGIRTGQLINTGDSIDVKVAATATIETVKKTEPVKKKKVTKRSRNKKDE